MLWPQKRPIAADKTAIRVAAEPPENVRVLSLWPPSASFYRTPGQSKPGLGVLLPEERCQCEPCCKCVALTGWRRADVSLAVLTLRDVAPGNGSLRVAAHRGLGL